MTELLRQRGTATVVAEVAGVTKRSVERAKKGRAGSYLLRRLHVAAAGEVYDSAREQRLRDYAALVESRGGWDGGGWLFERPRPPRSLAWLDAQAGGLREVEDLGDDDDDQDDDEQRVGAA